MSKVDKRQQARDDPKKDKKLEELEAQVEELTNALQRERADSINLRRRVEEDRSKMADVYKAQVVRQLLPALDNLERALKHTPLSHPELVSGSKDKKEWIPDQVRNDKVLLAQWEKFIEYVKGVQGVAKQFDKALEELGVKRIKTEGQKFDPALHEAVSVDQDSDGDTEVVAEELQAGYTLGDEVIRHAFVKVKMEKGKNNE